MRTKGYIALISVLIISAVAVGILTVVSLNSVYILRDINNVSKSSEVYYKLSACLEDSLYTYNYEKTIPYTITILDYTCQVSNIVKNGTTWDYQINLVISGYNYYAYVNATRSDRVYLNSVRFSK